MWCNTCQINCTTTPKIHIYICEANYENKFHKIKLKIWLGNFIEHLVVMFCVLPQIDELEIKSGDLEFVSSIPRTHLLLSTSLIFLEHQSITGMRQFVALITAVQGTATAVPVPRSPLWQKELARHDGPAPFPPLSLAHLHLRTPNHRPITALARALPEPAPPEQAQASPHVEEAQLIATHSLLLPSIPAP